MMELQTMNNPVPTSISPYPVGEEGGVEVWSGVEAQDGKEGVRGGV